VSRAGSCAHDDRDSALPRWTRALRNRSISWSRETTGVLGAVGASGDIDKPSIACDRLQCPTVLTFRLVSISDISTLSVVEDRLPIDPFHVYDSTDLGGVYPSAWGVNPLSYATVAHVALRHPEA
jgi:hypothetical protein